MTRMDWYIPANLCDQSDEIARLKERIAELEAQNRELREELCDALKELVGFAPLKYREQLKKARGEA